MQPKVMKKSNRCIWQPLLSFYIIPTSLLVWQMFFHVLMVKHTHPVLKYSDIRSLLFYSENFNKRTKQDWRLSEQESLFYWFFHFCYGPHILPYFFASNVLRLRVQQEQIRIVTLTIWDSKWQNKRVRGHQQIDSSIPILSSIWIYHNWFYWRQLIVDEDVLEHIYGSIRWESGVWDSHTTSDVTPLMNGIQMATLARSE